MTHQVDDLVDVVHEGDVGLPVRPDEEAGGGADVVPRVDLGGGVQEGGQGDPGAHRPDGEDGEAEGKVRGLERLGPGDSTVSEMGRMITHTVNSGFVVKNHFPTFGAVFLN